MKQRKKPVRIKDIASKAGVSVGTVDRVLHGRGSVSKVKEKKVRDAIASLQYEPNMMARSLAMNSNYRIAVVIPNFSKDSFWKEQIDGINKALLYIKDFGFSIKLLEFDDQKQGDLLKHLAVIKKEKFDALLIAPTVKNDGNKFLDNCCKKKIPYVLVNTNLNRADDYCIAYVGQNSYQSGLLGAKLLSLMTRKKGKLLILHMEKDVENSIHLIEKERGFIDFLAEDVKRYKRVIVESLSKGSRDKPLKKYLSKLLKNHRDISGIFVTTSKVHKLIYGLREIERQDLSVVGFDLVEENIKALDQYANMFLINQNPGMQGYSGLITAFEFLLKKTKVEKEMFLPLDVITKENLSTYLESRSFNRKYL